MLTQVTWAESRTGTCHAAACRYLSWASPAKVPEHSPAFMSEQVSDLWDLSLLPRSFLQPHFTFYFLDTPPHLTPPFFFFPRPLLPFAKPSSVHHLFFPGPYTPSFRNPDSLGKEAQHMIGLLIGGTLSSLSLNWKIQDVTLLFSPGVIKIYSQPIPAAASK